MLWPDRFPIECFPTWRALGVALALQRRWTGLGLVPKKEA
jgi:hypothetical protein